MATAALASMGPGGTPAVRNRLVSCFLLLVLQVQAKHTVKLYPDLFKQRLRELGKGQRLIVDHTPFSAFGDLFEEAAGRAEASHTGTTWAQLDCLKYMDFCDENLAAEVWNGLRLYFKGASPSKKGHVEIPAAAFAPGAASNAQRLLTLAAEGTTKADALKLTRGWREEAESQAREVEQQGGKVLTVTDASFQSVLGKVFDDPGHQVWVLYHGSLQTCDEQRGELLKAWQSLSLAETTKVTVATANCDIYVQACEAASLAQYCYMSQHVSQNTCGQTYGPKGQAMYIDEMAKEPILAAMRERLPASVVAGSGSSRDHTENDEL